LNVEGAVASVVVSVYNEKDLLRPNALSLISYLEEALEEYELVLVENGSVDNTLEEAKRLSSEVSHVKVLTLPEPSIGEALRASVYNARYEKVVYFPIDLSVDLSFIPESVRLLDEYPIVIGSKRMKGAHDNRSILRRTASKGYHSAVRLLFRTHLSDTTCVKAYRRSVVLDLMRQVPTGSSIYETELLLVAQDKEYAIAQVSVSVNDQRRGRIPLLFKIGSNAQDLFSLRIDVFSIIIGSVLLAIGLFSIGYLSLRKLVFQGEGFLSPYSFLIAVLLVLFGGQGIVYGLLMRLILQLRREITISNSRHVYRNVFKEKQE